MSMRIKKIVILVYKLTGGGAERVASLWASGFANRGYDVTVITATGSDENMTYDLASSVKHFAIDLPITNRLMRYVLNKIGFSEIYFLRKLSKQIHSIKPDLCIGVLGKYALQAYKCTRDLNCKIINTEHNAYDRPEFIKNRPDVIKMKFETNRIFDRVTVLTKADTKVPGVPKENMTVLPNPLAFEPAKEIPHKENVILATGRLDVWEVKGFDNLIRAWGKIAKYYPEWRLVIAGTGSKKSKDYLMELSEKENVKESVLFPGFCNNIIDYYKKASIFVLSSRYEGFGMALTEAMSQGCACIACDFNGRQREIIQNDSQGIICSNDNYIELSNAIKLMIDDSDYRENCRHYAIERSKYYLLDKTIDRWEKIFKTL